MRTFNAGALAAMQGRALPLAVFVEMSLTSNLYLNTTSIDLSYGGNTYYGTKGLGTIDVINETPAEVASLKFTMSGVPSASVALALTEPVQGKLVTVKLAVFDPATYQILDVRTRWAGRCDVFAIDDGQSTATITVTAEHAGIDLIRPTASLYTDIEQQRLNPGDTALQFMNDQVEQTIVWPSAAWYRR